MKLYEAIQTAVVEYLRQSKGGNEREKSHHLLVLKEVVLRPIFQKGEEAITHFTFLSVFQDFCLPFVITKL